MIRCPSETMVEDDVEVAKDSPICLTIAWEGIYNRSDGISEGRSTGLWSTEEAAQASVKGKSWWGSDGTVKRVICAQIGDRLYPLAAMGDGYELQHGDGQ